MSHPDLNLDLPRLGLPRQAFGAAMVSSIGMTGITHAYSPLAPYYRVPLLILVGAVQDKPVVVSGAVVARPILTLTATVDHRYTDGLKAAEFAGIARDYLAAPSSHPDGGRTTAIPQARSPGSDGTSAAYERSTSSGTSSSVRS